MSGSLAGTAIARARVQLGAWGLPWADVSLPVPTVLAVGAHVDLVIADATMKVTVVAGGAFEGNAAYRVVGGTGGWRKTIPAKSYANDAAVKTSTVLTDAANVCGETIADLPASRMGPHYARASDVAAMTLHALAPRNWYVDFAGVTRIGQRPTTTYAGTAPRTHVDPQGQVIELAVESVAGLVPGVVVDGMAPATDVEFVLEPTRLMARVWGGAAPLSRRLAALTAIARAAFPRDRYRGAYEFRVINQTGERFNLQPVRNAIGFDVLANVPVRPGVAGARNTVTPGELVVVQFLDSDPSRPVITSHDAPDAPGWMPLTIELGGPGALGVACVTSPVVAGPFAGTVTLGSARVKAVLV